MPTWAKEKSGPVSTTGRKAARLCRPDVYKRQTFTWDDALLDYLVKKSYSMTYGARNLRRQIQKDLEDDIATKLIDSYLHPIQSIHASADGEHPVLTAE